MSSAPQGFVYRVLEEGDEARSVDVMVEGFCDEPCTTHVEADREERKRQLRVFCGLWSKEACSNSLSIGCFDADSGRMAGCFWVRDIYSGVGEHALEATLELTPAIAPVLRLLGALDERFALEHGLREPGQLVDLWMLSVHPDFRRKGLASSLTRRALERASEPRLGFQRVMIECTGDYSARCAQQAGMQFAVSVTYADTDTFATLDHEALAIYQKILK